MSSYLDVLCPKCGAGVNKRCRSGSGRVTDTHVARIELWSKQHGWPS